MYLILGVFSSISKLSHMFTFLFFESRLCLVFLLHAFHIHRVSRRLYCISVNNSIISRQLGIQNTHNILMTNLFQHTSILRLPFAFLILLLVYQVTVLSLNSTRYRVFHPRSNPHIDTKTAKDSS